MIVNENLIWAIIIVASVAILLLVLRMLRSKKGKFKLEKDPSGFWRYHKGTEFKRKVAYRVTLEKKKKKADSSSAKKADKKDDDQRKAIAVIEFDGDLRAKQRTTLAKLTDEVEVNKDSIEEVVVVLSSAGGMVPHYGHAYSQMERIRKLGLDLTVCIDVVAASGGYLMGLPANKIIAAPFSMVGSVGVLAFVPNFRNLLHRLDIQPRTFTAGKYKRTVTLTDNATEEEVERFKSELEVIHRQFVSAVKTYRPNSNIEEIGTGAHWTAAESIEKGLGLVDELSTSSEYLLKRNSETDLVLFSTKKSFWEDGFSLGVGIALEQFFSRIWGRFAGSFNQESAY